MNIYLDIEGVVLDGGVPAPYLEEFLKYITDNYTVYWLTTYCKGDKEYTVNLLKKYLPNNLIPYIEKIKETNWNIHKTEAIDFSKDFIWIDDHIFPEEIKVLKEKNKEDSLYLVNRDNKDKLIKIYKVLGGVVKR